MNAAKFAGGYGPIIHVATPSLSPNRVRDRYDIGLSSCIDPLLKVHVPETTRAALYSFTYSVGSGAFASSTLLRKLNAGDVPRACKELQRWTYAGGKQWKGLISRREIEREVCEWSQK